MNIILICIYIEKTFLYKEGKTIHIYDLISFFTCLLKGEGVKQGQLPRGQVTIGQGGGGVYPCLLKRLQSLKY